MRVITGKYKGRKLSTPPNYDIRPTTDKTKEALFSILANEIYGSRVLDLFSGTGSLGIEALSRGASYCAFADSSKASIAIIKENLDHCRIGDEGMLLPGDYRKVLMNLSSKIEGGLEEKFDIIILDPPYNKGMIDIAFGIISEKGILAEDGTIVAEHRKEEILPDVLYGYRKVKERRYGVAVISIYNI